jgi:ubiquitin-protein ligase E3 C
LSQAVADHRFCEFSASTITRRRRYSLICRGFKQLNPLFAIRDAGSDELRLPTASTCVNLLKVSDLCWRRERDWLILNQMPRYQSEKVLRDKLLQAISSGAGFDLS